MTHATTWVGFGDPETPARFVRFHVDTTGGDDVHPDWTPEPNRTVRQIAGSNNFDVYVGGFGPSRITLEVWFDTPEAYRTLRAMYLRSITGTLSLLAGFTSHEGIIRTYDGVRYEQFRDTLIDTIGRPRFQVEGIVECELTFLRAEAVPSW